MSIFHLSSGGMSRAKTRMNKAQRTRRAYLPRREEEKEKEDEHETEIESFLFPLSG